MGQTALGATYRTPDESSGCYPSDRTDHSPFIKASVAAPATGIILAQEIEEAGTTVGRSMQRAPEWVEGLQSHVEARV
jgi:hypothetical protein